MGLQIQWETGRLRSDGSSKNTAPNRGGVYQQGGSHKNYGKGTTDSFVEDMMKNQQDFFFFWSQVKKKKEEAEVGDGRLGRPESKKTNQQSTRQAREYLGQELGIVWSWPGSNT